MGEIKMKVRLAIAMCEDGSYFITGNSFEEDERLLSRIVADMGLTGREPAMQYFVDVDLPEKIIGRDEITAREGIKGDKNG